MYGTPANSVLAYYLEVTPPNCYNHFILKISHGPVLVYLHQVKRAGPSRSPRGGPVSFIPNERG